MKQLVNETINTFKFVTELYQERGKVKSREEHRETRKEEIASGLTHLMGAMFGIIALIFLVTKAQATGDQWHLASYPIFGVSAILLYLASTIYHFVRPPKLKKLFRILDHSAIYILIAGTYTPFTLVALQGTWGWTLFGIVWGLAFFGILFKVFFVGKMDFISTMLYIGMGWIVVIAAGRIYEAMSAAGIFWLFMGGISYTGGVIFYLWDDLPYNHAIWHLFVVGGTVSHFISIYNYI